MADYISKALQNIKAEIEERSKKQEIDDELVALSDLAKLLENFRVEVIRVANSELRVRGDYRVIKFKNGLVLAIPLKNEEN